MAMPGLEEKIETDDSVCDTAGLVCHLTVDLASLITRVEAVEVATVRQFEEDDKENRQIIRFST